MADDEQLAELVAAEPELDECSRWIMTGFSLCAFFSIFSIVAFLFLVADGEHSRFITAIVAVLVAPLGMLAIAFFCLFVTMLFEHFGCDGIYADPRRRLADDMLMFFNRYV
jgi:hypothetical protein